MASVPRGIGPFPFVSETARERETFTFDDLGITTAALRSPSPDTETEKLIPSSILSSTPDPALTAFAQLGLYRLNASHSIVSLFDRTYQHFVADAVRCSPLQGDKQPTALGRRTFSGTAILRAQSICEHVLTGLGENASVLVTATNGAPALPVSVIPDLELDPRFGDLRDEVVKGKRFYAGVPIRSPSGINIGVYCVLDEKPRPGGLTPDQIQFIRDISQTVMDYLHAKRSNEWYRREERMVRGLGSFVEGHATLSNWSDHLDNSSFRDIPGVQEGALNKKLQATPQGNHNSNEYFPDSSASFFDSPRSSHINRSASSTGSADMLLGDVERVFSKACNIIRESIEVEGVLYLDASVHTFGGLVGKEVFEPPILETVSSADSDSDESQAALLNTNADQQHCNVLGFSTSSGSSINGNRPLRGHTAVPEGLLQKLLQRYPHGRIFKFEPDGLLSDHSGSDDEDSSSPTSPLSPASPHPFGPDEETRAQRQMIAGNQPSIATSLLKIFPGARSLAFVPLFDAQKHRWFAGGFVWTKTPTRIFTVENELSYLRVFGLATMAEVARLNTKAADKTKTDILGSISHELRSPLHGVVGSVELLRNTVLDGTQENILRTIETSGRTLLDTIDHVSDACNISLHATAVAQLTTKQLLDYSKVNNIVRPGSRSERKDSIGSSSRRSRRNTVTLAALNNPPLCVHLDRLAEEVVESVLAGWSYRNLSDANFAAWNSIMKGASKPLADSSDSEITPGPFRPTMPHARNRNPVQIYLDIDHAVNWTFQTHPGAFRRIVLNLFGNSLKFTKTGFIRVSLQQEPLTNGDFKCFNGYTGDRQQRPVKVVLTVSDSGKGISKEYLSHNLFTPFSQEDQFAPGTGLGLSLVKQMVVSLGGSIDVLSQVGQGTTITVALPISPFTQNRSEIPEGLSEDIDAGFAKNIQHHLAGKSVHLQGFEETLHIRDGVLGREDTKQKTQVQLLESICRGWLKMNVILPVLKVDATVAEVATIPEEDFVLRLFSPHGPGLADGSTHVHHVDRPTCPRLVVCRDSNTMYALTKPAPGKKLDGGSPSWGVSYIAQPIGPRKLAEALVASRLQWEENKKATCDGNLAVPNGRPLAEEAPHSPATVSDNDLNAPAATSDSLAVQLPDAKKNGVTAALVPSIPGNGLSDITSISPSRKEFTEPNKRFILVVDDNPINIKIIIAYVNRLKHPYVSAMNGLEAFQTYNNNPEKFRCIVTDISMPVMDGLECTRRIRELERSRKLDPVTVIALTGLSGEDIQHDAFVSGVDLFLTRPLAFKGLEKALEVTGHGPENCMRDVAADESEAQKDGVVNGL
ncbi:hypothetical protein V8F20_011470 [Naviculisporaceae sp. PSN 640]